MAGGFAKRLWPLTKEYPKPLLKIKGKPIIEYVLDKVKQVEEIDKIYITTNAKFEHHFKNELGMHFANGVSLFVESARREEEKLGAIGALRFIIKSEKIKDDLLVIAGDNVFGFDLKEFIDYYKRFKKPVVAFYDINDIEKVRGRYGVVILDKNNRVVNFQEKPLEPKSTFVSTGCYIFPKETLKLIDTYLADMNNPDAPGHFIAWLHKIEDVYGFVFNEHWFDIGTHESLKEAIRFFERFNVRV